MFAHGAIAGSYIFVSGSIGIDVEGSLVDGGVAAETTQALRNIERILTACDASLADVVKVNVLLVDMDAWQEMNDAYLAVFGLRTPARTSAGCTALALGAHVEIECVAYKPEG
jgi:2-iminobutanoate/2-iminopropanoate deaminase